MNKETRDQAAHAGAAFLVIVLAQLLGADIPPGPGALLGLSLGLVRELTEEGEISLNALKSAFGSTRDLLFWTLGGALGGIA